LEVPGLIWFRDAREQIALEPGNGRTLLGLTAAFAGAFLVGGWLTLLVPLIAARMIYTRIVPRQHATSAVRPTGPRAPGLG
jgi:hypothetical protein